MTEIIAKIAHYQDDASEDTDGNLRDHESDIYTYFTPSWPPAVYGGVRFQLNIPKGAIIDSAILNIGAYWSWAWGINIFGNAVDNSENFGDNPHIVSEVYRPRTTNFEEWQVDENYDYRSDSPDIKNVIQEIISRDGWAANNYLTLILVPLSNNDWWLEFYSYDGYGQDNAARLTINYHIPVQPPIYKPNKKAFTGYHCFMEQYIKNIEAGVNAYKLPDGTLW
ncbi:MAG: hypothetical protein PHS93_08385 [Candidatus Omnitrophica bacterium]|nr:hypothetical protein [Candidatus Omnitrophota bacterium]MDD5353160.1 hypothetical protein [Candidatus Omnitrophota bacterium]MDD5551141.1 hypothetical protein [Candidatus Omnitrophota bacterium]